MGVYIIVTTIRLLSCIWGDETFSLKHLLGVYCHNYTTTQLYLGRREVFSETSFGSTLSQVDNYSVVFGETRRFLWNIFWEYIVTTIRLLSCIWGDETFSLKHLLEVYSHNYTITQLYLGRRDVFSETSFGSILSQLHDYSVVFGETRRFLLNIFWEYIVTTTRLLSCIWGDETFSLKHLLGVYCHNYTTTQLYLGRRDVFSETSFGSILSQLHDYSVVFGETRRFLWNIFWKYIVTTTRLLSCIWGDETFSLKHLLGVYCQTTRLLSCIWGDETFSLKHLLGVYCHNYTTTQLYLGRRDVFSETSFGSILSQLHDYSVVFGETRRFLWSA